MARETSEVKWTIGILTVPSRRRQLAQLFHILLPQVDKYKGKIEILIFWNNGEYTLGHMRQKVVDDARGEYISFIDDDDLVPEDFCETIMPLLDGVDYIGFKVRFIDIGVEKKPAYHSLRWQTWHEDDKGYYRGITHLNPLRTEIARKFPFKPEYNSGEDAEWANRVKAETEHYIDEIMYVYQHTGEDFFPAYGFRPEFNNKNVRFHGESTKTH